MNGNKRKGKTSKLGDTMNELHHRKTATKNYWGEFDDLSNTCGTSLINTLQHINGLVGTEGLVDNIEFLNEATVLINGIKRDINIFTDELVAIKKRHEGRKGQICSDEDVMESISIGNDYITYDERFRSIVVPAVLSLTEMVANAAQRIVDKERGIQDAEVVQFTPTDEINVIRESNNG